MFKFEYEIALKQIMNANEYCKKFVEKINKNIPKDECNKNKLITIALADNICFSSSLIAMLQGRLRDMRKVWGNSPDTSGIDTAEKYEAQMKVEEIYINMIDALKKYDKKLEIEF